MEKICLLSCKDMHMDKEKIREYRNLIEFSTKYLLEEDYKESDIIIVFTCAFNNAFRKTSVSGILNLLNEIRHLKRRPKVYLTGCLVAYSKSIKEEYFNKGNLNQSFEAILEKDLKEKLFYEDHDLQNHRCNQVVNTNNRDINDNVIVISSGCTMKCTYCIYPIICNEYISKCSEDVMSEIEILSKIHNEIIISGGHETSMYGIDLYGRPKLNTLIDTICSKFSDVSFTIGWLHPIGLNEEFLNVLKNNKNILKVMVHIEHVSNRILALSNRPKSEKTDEMLRRLIKTRPDIKLSTQVITGLFNETHQEFLSLVRYLDQKYFDDIGVSNYEVVKGTTASLYSKQTSIDISKKRMEYIKKRLEATMYLASVN